MATKRHPRRSSPVVNNGLFQAAHRQVNQDARAMERVREGGYGALDQSISRLYRRLTSTQKGQARSLTRSNARSLDLILKATANNRAANRRLTQSTNRGLAAYGDAGGMLTQELGRVSSGVHTAARNARSEQKGDIKNAKQMNSTARGLIGITKAQTKESQANADTLAAEALDRRTTSDLALIAQQHHDIAMQKMQYQQQVALAEREQANAEKMARLQHRLTMKEMDPQNAQMMTTAVDTMGSVGIQAMQFKAANPTLTPEEAIKQLQLENPTWANMSPNEVTAINQIIRSVFTNDNPNKIDPVAQEVMDIIRQQPGWDKLTERKQKEMKKWITSSIKARIPKEWVAQQVAAATPSPSPSSFYQDPVQNVTEDLTNDQTEMILSPSVYAR